LQSKYNKEIEKRKKALAEKVNHDLIGSGKLKRVGKSAKIDFFINLTGRKHLGYAA